MGKTVTITVEEFRKLVAQTITEIMDKHGRDTPQGALVFSLATTVFSAMLTHKLFSEDEDNE